MKSQLSSSLAAIAVIMTSTAIPAQAGSWIKEEALSENPQAYCSDIVASEKTATEVARSSSSESSQSNRSRQEQMDTGMTETHRENESSNTNKHQRQNQTKVKAKANIGPFGGSANVNHSEKESRYKHQEQSSAWDYKNQYNESSRNASASSQSNSESSSTRIAHQEVTAKAAGKNCDAFVRGAAAVETTEMREQTNRQAIEARKEVQMEQLETRSSNRQYNQLMSW
jgi:hypothetical protein